MAVDFFLTVENGKLQDKVDENIRLGERETALVRLCCPYSRPVVNYFVCFINTLLRPY